MNLESKVPVSNGAKQASKQEPDAIVSLQNRMNRQWDELSRWFGRPMLDRPWGLRPWADFPSTNWPAWDRNWAELPEPGMPRINVTQQNGTVKVEAQVPGMEEQDLQITLSDNVLTLKGEHRSEKTEEDADKQTYRSEFFRGAFERSVSMPTEVLADKAKATFKNGVLTVEIPVNPQTAPQTRKVPISSK